MIELYDQYQHRVLAGEVLVCSEVRQAIERQERNLAAQRTKDFPYYFDRKEANRVLKFISILKCTGGAWKGKRIPLQDFQCWRIAVLFGWRRVEDNTRRFRTAYIEVARKQGKTEEAAALSTYCLVADGEPSAEVYSAATMREQARRTFNAAKIMLRELLKESLLLRKRLKIYRNSVVDTATDSCMMPLSAEANTLDGLSPSFSAVDELHAHTTSAVIEVLESGQGAREQPMLYMITTAGFDMQGPCYELRGVAKNILAGILEDESFFSVIYTLDEGDDWKAERNWVKANPGIGVTPRWPFMRDQFTKARTRGKTAEIGFKTKNLNMWVASATGWIKDEAWMACPSEIDLESLRGRKCYGGLDLASTSDFSSLCLFFPGIEGEAHRLLWWHWIPEEVYEERALKMPSLFKWNELGYVETTPGNVMDYDYIEARLIELQKMYDFVKIGCDPYNAIQLIAKMQAQGLPIEDFSQSIGVMSAPTKEFERLVGKQLINHGKNPVLRWMLGNVHLYKDSKDNIQVHKGKSKEKVDGVVAAIIALGQYMNNPLPKKSYMETEDLAIF